MSYDISVIKRNKEIYDDNYTYNVSKMFRNAIGENGIYELKEKSVKDAIPILEKAIAHMKNNPEIYEEMNPKNGWGNYEDALKVLEDLHRVCLKNKNSKTALIDIN